MERLAAKKGQGVLDVLRTSKDKGELKRAIQTWKDTDGQEGPAASETDILSKDESISFDEKRRKRAPKRAEFEPSNVASISDTGDLNAVDYLNPPETSGPSELKATTAEERADLEKKYGSWRAAKEAIKAEGDRYRAALQPKKGFEAQYDADVKFQEEEYGGGSLERDRMLAEIMGQEYQTDPDPVGVEGTITDRDLYEKYYAEAKEKNPSAQKEQLQDAAIKGVMADQAERAALEADKFPELLEGEATETVGAGLGYEKTLEELRQEKADREAAAQNKNVVKGAVEKAKKTGPGGADTRRQPTDTERAAQKALSYDVETGTFSRDGRVIPQAKVIEDSVDETPTDEIVDETVTESAPQKLFNTYSDRQRASILSQPGGSNFSEALENLSEGNLQGFNEAIKGGRYKQFRVPQGKRFRVEKRFVPQFTEFLERVPPDLKASVVQQLEQKVSEKAPAILESLKGPVEQTLYDQVSEMKGVPTPQDEAVIKEFAEVLSNHYFNAEPAQLAQFGRNNQQFQIVQDFMEAIGASPTWAQTFKGTIGTPGVGLASDIFANKPTLFNDLVELKKAKRNLQGIKITELSPSESIIASAAAGE
jgi:hypothetical protein